MKKFRPLLAAMLLALTLLGCGKQEQPLFSGGTGTQEDPYRIATAQDLRQLSQLTQDEEGGRAYRERCFQLTGDIDLENRSFSSLFAQIPFEGVFDGNGHTISGLKIQYQKPLVGAAQANHGLFASGSKAVVRNLTIRDSLFASDSGTIAPVMGNARDCTIENCHVTDTVTVTADYTAAGIVGKTNRGQITGCTNAAAVTATGNVGQAGGIAAYSSSLLTDCRNDGAIASESDAGGIAAVQNNSIQDCVNTGSVTARKNKASGIAGFFGDGALNQRENDESVQMLRCVNSGTVTSASGDAGGIVAQASTGSIRQCENTGAVTTACTAGGIVGVFQSGAFGQAPSAFVLEECRNEGLITTTELTFTTDAGGICAVITGMGTEITIRSCHNTGDISSMHRAAGTVSSFQGSRMALTDCRNEGRLSGYTICGGIVAQASAGQEEDCQVTILGCTNAGDLYTGRAAGFAGVARDSYAGGILGYLSVPEGQAEVALTIEESENTGTLECEAGNASAYTDPICASPWTNVYNQ